MDNKLRQWIDPRDKPGLLLAMMRAFKNNAHISFEGDLSNLSFAKIPNVSNEETEALKRQTTYPELDFIVLPLSEQTIEEIWKELSEKDHLVHEGIIHVQIEEKGSLVFGGYDNFHRDCTIAYQGVPITLLDELMIKGIIRGYTPDNSSTE